MSRMLMADSTQTRTPDANAEMPASVDSAIAKTSAVIAMALKVGQDPCRRMPHQPFLFTIFLAISFTRFRGSFLGPLCCSGRTQLIQFPVIGPPDDPRTHSQ